MAYPLSLAAGTLPEFAPDQVAEAAGRAGFHQVGFTIEPDAWNATALRRTKAALRAHGLTALDTEVVWIPEGGALDDGHRTIIEAGAELDAKNVLVVSSEPDTGRTAEALRRLCEWAAPAGMRIAIEFLMITAIRSIDIALEVVRKCDHPAAAILVDTLHLQRAGHLPSAIEPIDPNLLPYAQFCDGPAACEDDSDAYLTDAIDLRSAPGEGELPLKEVLMALPCNLPLSLEIRSKVYRDRYADPAERAAAVRKASLAFFETNGFAAE